jgi:hypothetical protein
MRMIIGAIVSFVAAGIFGFCGWYYISNAKRLTEEIYNRPRSVRFPWSYLFPAPNLKKDSFALRLRLIGYCAFGGATAIICLTLRNLLYGVS